MSRTVTIPTCHDPYQVEINNKIYTYKAGETVEVPDEVAEVIQRDIDEHINRFSTEPQVNWGAETADGCRFAEVTKHLEWIKKYGTNFICAEMTPEEYEIMMASEDFECTFVDQYSGVYKLSNKDFSYDSSKGIIKLKTAYYNIGAYADICFTNLTYSKIPSAYLETPDQSIPHLVGSDDNPVILRHLETGAYILDGTIRAYPGAGKITFWKQFAVVSPVPAQGKTYVQVMFPASNAIHQYAVTDNSAVITKSYIGGVTNLVGTYDSPIVVRNLSTGVYVLNGYVQLNPKTNAVTEWMNILTSVHKSGSTAKVMAYFPANHGIHHYVIDSSTMTLTTAYLGNMATKSYVDSAVANAIAAAIEEGLS